VDKPGFIWLLYLYVYIVSDGFQVGLRSITKEGREQGKRFGVEQYEMRTFSRDREKLENLVTCKPQLLHVCFTLSVVHFNMRRN
jgi:hypothetical protein